MPDSSLTTAAGQVATWQRSALGHSQKMVIEDTAERALSVAVGSATVTSVAASGGAVTLLAANAARRKVLITNDADGTLYVKLGTAASATSFTVKVEPDGYWEMPPLPAYTGEITGIWGTAPGGGAAAGAARLTEM